MFSPLLDNAGNSVKGATGRQVSFTEVGDDLFVPPTCRLRSASAVREESRTMRFQPSLDRIREK